MSEAGYLREILDAGSTKTFLSQPNTNNVSRNENVGEIDGLVLFLLQILSKSGCSITLL